MRESTILGVKIYTEEGLLASFFVVVVVVVVVLFTYLNILLQE